MKSDWDAIERRRSFELRWKGRIDAKRWWLVLMKDSQVRKNTCKRFFIQEKDRSWKNEVGGREPQLEGKVAKGRRQQVASTVLKKRQSQVVLLWRRARVHFIMHTQAVIDRHPFSPTGTRPFTSHHGYTGARRHWCPIKIKRMNSMAKVHTARRASRHARAHWPTHTFSWLATSQLDKRWSNRELNLSTR